MPFATACISEHTVLIYFLNFLGRSFSTPFKFMLSILFKLSCEREFRPFIQTLLLFLPQLEAACSQHELVALPFLSIVRFKINCSNWLSRRL
jgi:hypothetical protein